MILQACFCSKTRLHLRFLQVDTRRVFALVRVSLYIIIDQVVCIYDFTGMFFVVTRECLHHCITAAQYSRLFKYQV